MQFSKYKHGGDEEDRTPDPLRARQVLSQLSYIPKWSGRHDSNVRPPAPKAGALPTAQRPEMNGF